MTFVYTRTTGKSRRAARVVNFFHATDDAGTYAVGRNASKRADRAADIRGRVAARSFLA